MDRAKRQPNFSVYPVAFIYLFRDSQRGPLLWAACLSASNPSIAKRVETSLFALRLIITQSICFSDICLLHGLNVSLGLSIVVLVSLLIWRRLKCRAYYRLRGTS